MGNVRLTGKSRCGVHWLIFVTFFNHANATTQFPITTNPAVIEYCVGIAFDRSNYLVEILTGTNINTITNLSVQLISGSGALLGSQAVVGGGASLKTAGGLVFGNTNYLLAWSDSTISSGLDMFGQLISRNGVGVGSKFNLLPSEGSYGFQTVKAVASDGTNYLVVWQDGNDNYFYGQLITPAGTLSGSPFLVSSQQGNGQSAAIAFGKTNYLVVWQSQNGPDTDLTQSYGDFISTSGSVNGPFQISQAGTTNHDPVYALSAAFDGTNYLAVWAFDNDPAAELIYGRLVSQSGAFPGNELALVTNGDQVAPMLAFDGANYLLGYNFDGNTSNSNRNMYCQFLDRSAELAGVGFTPFEQQGTNLPLSIRSILFDGKRFALTTTLGVVGINGEVVGAFVPSSTASPTLTPGQLFSGQFPLRLTGTPGINYAIQFSTNLSVSDWTCVITNSPTNGDFSFTDTNAKDANRFYRAVKH